MATAVDPASLPQSASPSSSTGALESVPFSSGNPRIEETRGVVLLHPDPPASAAASSSSSHLPVRISLF
jgi:BRCA1-associated protein